MMESEKNMDPDRNAESFGLYVSAAIEPQRVLEMVCGDDAEDNEDLYDIVPARDITTQQICQLHRERAFDGGKLYTELLLVADSDEPETRGVLVVNLKPYHGYPDAVRHEPEEAGDAVASLSIMNTDWYDERQSVGGKSPLVPEDWFALYDLLGGDQDDVFELAVKTMNDGVQEKNVNPDIDDGSEPVVPGPPYGTVKRYHRGVRPSDQELAQVIRAHPSYAGSHNLETSYLAVIDSEYEEQGALIVRVEPSTDSFRCKVPVAGEILGWIYINFMTWDEAREFAGKQ